MSSKKYIGYVGGAAVAAGVGAVIAVAGQGTAHADTDGGKPASSHESKAPAAAKPAKKDAPKASATGTQSKPTFDAADTVKDLKKQFAATKSTPTKLTSKRFTPLADLSEKASEAASVLTTPMTASAAREAKAAAAEPVTPPWALPNNVPAPWNWSPFRYSDPIPGEMPTPVWQLEQAFVNAFSGVPVLQPLAREGFEAGYRFTQVIPWVNVVIPLSNIVAQFPNLASGNAVLIKTATQSIINNLLVTTQPVSIAFYGYDEITDLLNVEYQGQQLKSWFYSTAWDVIDLFDLLHNRGQSGLPLGVNSTGPHPPAQTPDPAATEGNTVALAASYSKAAAVTTNAAPATTDAPGSNPFRADDPWPTDMPANILGIEKSLVGGLPSIIAPFVREGFEAIYRASQMVPYVNAPIPLLSIVEAIFNGRGDKSVIQTSINNLLLTTPQVSFLYYGYDEIADLLNVEDQAEAMKQQFYAAIWDAFDSTYVLHLQGESGLPGDPVTQTV
jgi:hypothetical protein